MASGNALQHPPDARGITSGNTVAWRDREPAQLAPPFDQVLADYDAALARAPLAPTSRPK